MPWRAITTANVLAEFTPAEQAVLSNIQGVTTALQQILTDTMGEFIGAMTAAGYNVNSDGTVPDQLRRHIIARARWGWLNSFPMLKAMQTDPRKKANDDAESMLEKVATRKAGALEDPNGTVSSAANWNSNNKIIMRTQPTPPPSQQFPTEPDVPGYANPEAPSDN